MYHEYDLIDGFRALFGDGRVVFPKRSLPLGAAVVDVLNMSEEEMTQYVSDNEQALYRLISGGTSGLTDDWGDTGSLEVPYATLKIVYYDTLDAMLLALNAGEIIGLET